MKYYKTSGQYWKEWKRRKDVLSLLEKENLTQTQVAERLGVNERTIGRDVAKLRPYQERKFQHQLRQLQKERDAQFEAQLTGKTPLEKLKVLTQIIAQRNKAVKMREYYRHQIFVSIDLDKMTNGFPEVRIWPKNSNTKLKMPITLNFRYIKKIKQ